MLRVTTADPCELEQYELVSCLGHESTAVIASELLGRKIEWDPARRAVRLDSGDVIFVLTLFNGDGTPYRSPKEGTVLAAAELRSLRVSIRKVSVGGPTPLAVEDTIEHVLKKLLPDSASSAVATARELSINIDGAHANSEWYPG